MNNSQLGKSFPVLKIMYPFFCFCSDLITSFFSEMMGYDMLKLEIRWEMAEFAQTHTHRPENYNKKQRKVC